jgi:hypothetical protein
MPESRTMSRSASHDVFSSENGGGCPLPADERLPADAGLTSKTQSLTPQLREALEAVEASVAEMNETVRRAMEAGVIIELRRRYRVHSGDGRWADQLAPLVQAHPRT